MSTTVDEKDFGDAAEKVLRGKLAAAASSSAAVVATVATGHPLVGVASKVLVEAVAKVFQDKNTERLILAGQTYDRQVETEQRLVSLFKGELSPLAAEARERFDDLEIEQQLLFARTLVEIRRSTASAAQAERMLGTMESIKVTLEEVANRLVSPATPEVTEDSGLLGGTQLAERAARPDVVTLVTEMVPRLRNLIRLADDLRNKSDYYLGLADEHASLEEQVEKLGEAVAEYRAAWFEVDQRKHAFRAVLGRLSTAGFESAALGALLVLLSTEGDLTFGFPELPYGDPMQRYMRLIRDWRRFRTILQAILDRARELSSTADEALLELRLPWLFSGGIAIVIRDAIRLLVRYDDACAGLDAGVRVFAKASFSTLAEFRTLAWALAPSIEEWNAAYVEVQNESLLIRLGLVLDSSSRSLALRKRLEAIESFQWHEVRPLLNGLLVNVILAVYNDVPPEHLSEIRRQQREEWQKLDLVLQRSPGMAM